LGAWCVTTCVVVVFVAAVWTRPALDDDVALEPVKLDPVLVARVDPPPQPAKATAAAAALTARARERLTSRRARGAAPGQGTRWRRDARVP
jgi:hypothetical protein